MSAHRIAATAIAAAFAVPVALAGLPAAAQNITSIKACQQEIQDAEQARAENPKIGEKATQTFEQLLAEARRLCEMREFAEADQTINAAKGMVASE